MPLDQPLRGFVVLAVEDEPDTLNLLGHLIDEVFGCRVLSAPSGEDALRLIDSGVHVDLLFTDVMMPGKDGMTLAEELCKRLPDLSVVLATGRSDVVDQVVERGGVALLKPYTIERLGAVFTEALGIRPVGQ
jgi:two-component system, NtrC family, sensor kinase